MEAESISTPSTTMLLDWLCSECQSLFDSNGMLYPSHFEGRLYRCQPHHDMRELQACVELGCHICAALLKSVESEHIPDLEHFPNSNPTADSINRQDIRATVYYERHRENADRLVLTFLRFNKMPSSSSEAARQLEYPGNRMADMKIVPDDCKHTIGQSPG